ncbi:MAG: nucleotide-binding protein [Candidatus Methanoperedens sp.]
MMQKEEKVVVVLLVMAVLSLIIGYFGFTSEVPAYSESSKIGERVYVEGILLSKQMTGTGDHLILRISTPGIIIFIPRDNGANEVYDTFKNGVKVRITGKVAEYNNQKEIIVESAKDVVLLKE